ncbi:MAG TPA: hypothetical protein VKZ53_04235 [Candidatus Angelobacter sp.]|nr:hypothetical protein [Candidatus Angelobacter sp.]
MKPSKDKQEGPFSDDPVLVMRNLARLVRAYQAAPKDDESQLAALGVVLRQIQEEKKQRESRSNEPDGSGSDEQSPELEALGGVEAAGVSEYLEKTESTPAQLMGELLDGKAPIESWYERPSTARPPGVMLSPGAHNMVCICGGYLPFQGVTIDSRELLLIAPEIPKMAEPLDEAEQRKARELAKNLKKAAQDAGNGKVMLAVAPLSIWQNTSPTSGSGPSKS